MPAREALAMSIRGTLWLPLDDLLAVSDHAEAAAVVLLDRLVQPDMPVCHHAHLRMGGVYKWTSIRPFEKSFLELPFHPSGARLLRRVKAV